METLSFEQQVKGMTKNALIKMLDNQFGYVADEKVTREKLQETILQLYQRRLDESREQTAKATKKFEKMGDPIVRVLFQHLDGDVELVFAYDGGKGIKANAKGRWISKAPTFRLVNGQEYDLPLSVVDHLNSRVVPDVKVVPGPDGQITNMPYKRKRFSCEIKLTAEQRKALAEVA